MVDEGGVKISTKTIIGVSNVECDIDRIFSTIGVVEMDAVDYERVKGLMSIKKQRGRRKKESSEEVAQRRLLSDLLITPKRADIVALYCQEKHRGLPQFLKPNKKYFRNALNIVMMLSDTRKINFKLSKNGKVQMTGCKDDNDGRDCLEIFFSKLRTECADCIHYDASVGIQVHYYTVMTNIDFNTGFKINRQKLNTMMNQSTEYYSLLETSFGYTGVNIKLPMPMAIDDDYMIDRLTLGTNGQWHRDQVPFVKFFQSVDESFRNQELYKKRYNTFLVFHSGAIIMSGMRLERMLPIQKWFASFLEQHRADIEESVS